MKIYHKPHLLCRVIDNAIKVSQVRLSTGYKTWNTACTCMPMHAREHTHAHTKVSRADPFVRLLCRLQQGYHW
eukprot:c22739_g1_i1 orf=878-1096(-)